MDHDPLLLLRAYEPVVRFTRGEYFFPVSVEKYVCSAALWSRGSGEEPSMIAAPGGLDLDELARLGAGNQGLGQSLSGISTGESRTLIPLPINRPPRLKGGSRLAAVGMLGRLVDTLNRASLIFRGSVAGGSAYHSYRLQQEGLAVEEPTYYGRVIRSGSWIVCQYWYFYPFNNWRSAFGGVNEHEADWEQVTIYLDGTGITDSAGMPPPRWVVFSAHDETGDDLRRRWDDPDLGLVDGRHPIVYAGAGSHSGAYLAGDYLITIEPNTLPGVVRFLRWFARIFTAWSSASQSGIGIPYVDYARGDGRSVGPGQPESWHPVVIDDQTGWVRQYRGLWGLDTRDRLGGERGPAGPRYERDATVRQSWADPVGWSGLAKVAPNPDAEADLVRTRIAELKETLAKLEETIENENQGLQSAAAGLAPASPEVRALSATEEKLLADRMTATRLADEMTLMEQALEGGIPQPGPHDHLSQRRLPLAPQKGLRSRLLGWWAVLSTPAILYMLASIFNPGAAGVRTSLAIASLILLLLAEGFFRRRFLAMLIRIVIACVALIGLVFLIQDWRWVLTYGLLGAAIIVLLANLREALRR